MSIKTEITTTSAGDLEDEVLENLQALLFSLKGQLRHSLGEQPLALAPMEMRALQFFVRHPEASQSDLVQHSGRDKAQIARLIKSLLASGHLQASPDPEDRRSQRLSPTPSGLALHGQLHRARRQALARSLNGLEAAELAQLLGLLKRLRSNLTEPGAAPQSP